MKQVSNIVVHNKVTSEWDSVTKNKVGTAKAKDHLPPFTKIGSYYS